jgi:hypothetical protein
MTRESFGHIFYSCPSVAPLIDHMLTLFNVGNLDEEDKKILYWTGFIERHEKLQFLYLTLWEIFRHNLFRHKLRKNIPNHISLLQDSIFCLKTTVYNKPEYRLLIDTYPVLAVLRRTLG